MVEQVSTERAKEMVKGGEILIVDVRTEHEHKAKKIKGSILIPLNELERRIDEIPRDKPVLVYCRTGGRSMTASRILEAHGFKRVLNLSEGIVECPFECLDD